MSMKNVSGGKGSPGIAGGTRARLNSQATAKAVGAKQPPAKKFVVSPKTKGGAIKINTNPSKKTINKKTRPSVNEKTTGTVIKIDTNPSPIKKKTAPPMSNADIKKYNSFIDKLVAQQKTANK